MGDAAAPSIALLFDDTELVAQLREALHACDARIVHEGPIAGVTGVLLQEIDADVLVINLDDDAAEALDRLYALVDGERPRLVFNDAAASAALDGWDRARWARHLAAKVLQSADVDPPRPGPLQAQDAEVPPAPAPEASPEIGSDGLAAPAPDEGHPPAGPLPTVADKAGGGTDADEAERSRGDTEALSAELEALLASAELADSEADETTGDAGLLAPDGTSLAQFAPEADMPAEPAATAPDMDLDELLEDLDVADDQAGEPPAEPEAVASPDMDLDELLDDLDAADDQVGEAPEPPAEPVAVASPDMDLDELLDDLDAADDQAGEAPEPSAELEAAAAPDMGLDELLDDLGTEEDQVKELPVPPTEPAVATPPVMGLDDLLDGRGAQEKPATLAKPVATPPAKGLDDALGGLRLVEEPAPGEQRPGAGTSVEANSSKPAPVLPSVPDDWALVDDDALTPAMFGVEKQSAAEFLAPEADSMALDDEPVLNLELVSMEEAVAPRPPPVAVEMHLDELQVALSRLVLTGATLGGSRAALAFYAALPADASMSFVHAQHLRGQSVTELVAQLAAACPLPVALAADGVPTRPGQVLVVPPGYTVRVHRDARVDVQSTGEEQPEVSIDDSFSKAAEVFGRDALAIVFSGHNTDSIAGAKAVHAAGGRVWVETVAKEYADMVHEITGAGVVEFSGTPQELAARLAEKPA